MLCDSEHTLPFCSRVSIGVLESDPTVDDSGTFEVAPSNYYYNEFLSLNRE